MGALPKWDEYVSEAEYLEISEKSDERLEWIDGRIYPRHNPYGLLPQAMAGASDRHIDINTSLLIAVGNLLRGNNCFVVNQDQKVKTRSSFSFPDLTIYCGNREKDERGNLTNPVVIFEVLSPGTRAYDESEKFDALRQLPSLQDYLLVSQDRVLVEHRHRRAENRWDLIYHNRLDDQIALESIEITLAVSEIYERVQFEA